MINKELKKEIKRYQDLYLIVKAEYETIKEISKSNKLKVLRENVFTDEEGNRVLKYDFMITEDQFLQFNQLHFNENLKSGLDVVEPDLIPEYPKKMELEAIEKELFKLQLEIIPTNIREDIKKAQQHWKHREKALDLILRLDCR